MWIIRLAGLISLLLFIALRSRSQVNITNPPYQQIYKRAEKLYNSSNSSEITDSIAFTAYRQVAMILTKEKNYNDTLVDSYLKCGILQMTGNMQGRALDYFRLAIQGVQEHKQIHDSLLFKPYLYEGSIHYSLNNLDSAIYYYKKAEQIYDRYPDLNESERLLNKFGALYYETGDYNKSISYFEKALSLVEARKPLNVFFVINYKNNIATALMKLGKSREALTIFRDLLNYPNPGDELLYNLANTYYENNNYEEALAFLMKIRNMDFEKNISLTKIYIHLQRYDSAGFYLERAKKLYNEKKHYAPVITRGIILKYSGDLKAAAGKDSEALGDYQSAIINLDPPFNDSSLASNPVSFTGLQNFLFLFDALVAKASLLNDISRHQQGSQNLIWSMNAYNAALSLARHIEQTYFSDDARLFLKTKVNPATRDAVDVAIRLFHSTKEPKYINYAFGFSENNKATVLQAGLKNIELSSISELPAVLVSDEKKYRALLAKLNIESAMVKDSSSQTILQRRIHDVEISLAAVQDKLDENPLYHDLKFYNPTLGMDTLKNLISGDDEAILAYYYTSTNLICFYISRSESGFSSLPLHESLFSTIISLRRELQTPQASGRKTLRIAGTSLFQELIAPVYEKIKNKRKLIIIPFNEISYVPFEMMVNPADGSLLLKKFSVSYDYSAGFLADKKVGNEVPYRVLAMAPFSGTDNKNLVLPALSSSSDEIADLPGKKLIGKDAGKAEFVNLSNQFPVIHLATHAIANDTNLLGSYIEFYGLKNDADTTHRLYEQEIYTLDMKSARLVILSACETGNGLLVNGEGVISLSRAFSYAGCKSVITSLWKADEISTSFICKRLHKYLQRGLAVDEALQRAKIDYLETNEVEERYKNPAYWAHLVLIGDKRAVVHSPFNRNILWISMSVAALLIFILVKKKNQA
jgi:CHAT domain-containing protein/Tfp pilus assembly protein PilF